MPAFWYSIVIESVVLKINGLSDHEVQETLNTHAIGLTVEEARAVTTMLGRDPTLTEATIFGIQGSEHCSYKSSKRFLRTLPTKGKYVILGPGEDSGIVALTDGPKGKRWGIVASHESHNKPSQVVPYEGAATGVGGIVRDVLCMGARVVGVLDPLCFGDLHTQETHTIANEVIRGIAGYANPLGIPNLGGDTEVHSDYNHQCLVNVVCVGIVREDEIIHSYVPKEAGSVGYDIIIVGKPTDRSGFGGAAFASATLNDDNKESNSGAVQEPNPFLERHLLVSTYALFDWLAAEGALGKVGFKDLGAGGVVCASVEQVADQGLGAEIDLNKVHVSISDLPPEVIACAETQERFCWICHPDLTKHILSHYNETWDLPSIAENAGASVVGKVTSDPTYRLYFDGQIVCEALSTDLTCGFEYERPVKKRSDTHSVLREPLVRGNPPILKQEHDDLLASTIREKRLHYDKNVIGNTILEPDSAAAAVIAPLQDLKSYVHEGTHPGWDISEAERWRGVAVAVAGKGSEEDNSPYWQGAHAVIEAMRRVAAVGATPRALTDCLNYANPEVPEELWDFSEGVRGIAETAQALDLHGEPMPVISGNVSLYNRGIPPTAIVACIGVMPDARKAVGKSLVEKGAPCFSLTATDLSSIKAEILFVIEAIEEGLLYSCQTLKQGGFLMEARNVDALGTLAQERQIKLS